MRKPSILVLTTLISIGVIQTTPVSKANTTNECGKLEEKHKVFPDCELSNEAIIKLWKDDYDVFCNLVDMLGKKTSGLIDESKNYDKPIDIRIMSGVKELFVLINARMNMLSDEDLDLLRPMKRDPRPSDDVWTLRNDFSERVHSYAMLANVIYKRIDISKSNGFEDISALAKKSVALCNIFQERRSYVVPQIPQ